MRRYQRDDYLSMGLSVLGMAGNAFQIGRPCFTGDTPIITRRGHICFDKLTEQDEVLSGDEHDPHSLPTFRRVEEIFRNVSPIWHVHVEDRVIRSTAEHPFYVWSKGWIGAQDLQPGDLLRSHDGQFVIVKDVCEAGYEEAVYNCRISEYHSYFVGGSDWGFSVWAHNQCNRWNEFQKVTKGLFKKGEAALVWNAWDKGQSLSKMSSMNYHYFKHVLNLGLSKSVAEYRAYALNLISIHIAKEHFFEKLRIQCGIPLLARQALFAGMTL